MCRGDKSLIVKARSYDKDGRHIHIIAYMVKKLPLCPVTVLVDSQVSDSCPWATCYSLLSSPSTVKGKFHYLNRMFKEIFIAKD